MTKTVVWRSKARSPASASGRYRCLIPVRYLAHAGFKAKFSWPGAERPLDDSVAAVILVKAYDEGDLRLAREATERDIPVVLDICDNVFAEGYQALTGEPPLENVLELIGLCSAVVVPSSGLEDVLHENLASPPPIHVVPDPVETPSDNRWLARKYWQSRFAAACAAGWPAVASLLDGFRSSEIPHLGQLRRQLRADLARRRSPPRLPQLIWFGNPGGERPRSGLVSLLDVADDLIAVHRRHPFRLLIVTSRFDSYQRYIEPLPLETSFSPWDRSTIFGHLSRSAVALVPTSPNPLALAKSANRITLALSRGVPVVATRTPAAEPFEGCVVFDDFRRGVSTYLSNGSRAEEHLRKAQVVLRTQFSGQAVAKRWATLVRSVIEKSPADPAEPPAPAAAPADRDRIR